MVCALAISLIALTARVGSATQAQVEILTPETLVARITNADTPLPERARLFQSLERMDFARAMKVAPLLLGAADGFVRVRAAWVLAAGGDEIGVQVLRTIAAGRTDANVGAISALGRLRDPGSHDLLRRLLETELDSGNRLRSAGLISALTGALGDYVDPSDAALLVRVIEGKYGSGSWTLVSDVGKTGGAAAVPVLEDIFHKGKGWTTMAAGLGAARCGSAEGLEYVRRWLSAPPELADRRENFLSNAQTDDPHGAKAMNFILDALGVPADGVFLPELLTLASRTDDSRAKTGAWRALLRLNPMSRRKEILELAWENAGFVDYACKLIVLNDEAAAREFVRLHAATEDRETRRKASNLAQWLRRSTRERMDWQIVHGYGF
jgi:hypothetical protein